MKNFKVNEYFKDYAAIGREYFSDLRQVTQPKEVDGRFESTVLFNGEEYKKIERITDDEMYILLIPSTNMQHSSIVELQATKDYINLDTYKIIKSTMLEHFSYFFTQEGLNNEVLGKLTTLYLDVSDEIDNERYLLKYGMELELGKVINKKVIGSFGVFAKRDNKKTIYYRAHHGYLLDEIIITNKNTSLFEMMMDICVQIAKQNKTK